MQVLRQKDSEIVIWRERANNNAEKLQKKRERSATKQISSPKADSKAYESLRNENQTLRKQLEQKLPPQQSQAQVPN